MNQFFERYKEIFKEDFSRFQKTILLQSIFVNGLQKPIKEVIEKLQKEGFVFEQIPWSKNGFFVKKARFSIGSTTQYLLGHYSVQEAASQFPAIVFDPKEDEFVIDMCASPGMKTIQLASLMKNSGTIVACELKKERIESLKNNLERCNISNCIIINDDALNLDLKQKADKILLDAPCSGNFLTDKDWLKKRTLSDFQKMSKIQKQLIEKAVDLLKSGGELVYSTCSMEPEEDEFVIDWALNNLPVELEKITASFGIPGLSDVFGKSLNNALSKTWRMHPPKTEGFFVAKLRKR